MDAAEILTQARRAAGLSQSELARKAQVSPSVIGDYERGRFCPTVRQLDRLLAAAGYQLAPVKLQSLGADLDARIRESLSLTVDERMRRLRSPLDDLVPLLDGVPFVLEGAAAALLHGAPVVPETVDIAVPDQDDALAKLAAHFSGSDLLRFWDEERHRWTMVRPRPDFFREFGPMTRWRVVLDEARIRLVAPHDMPPTVHVEVDGLVLPVAGLWQLETGDPELAAVLARTRHLTAEFSPAAIGARTA